MPDARTERSCWQRSSATWTARWRRTGRRTRRSATSAAEAQGRIDAARGQLDGLSALRAALSRQLLTEGAITGKYTAMIPTC